MSTLTNKFTYFVYNWISSKYSIKCNFSAKHKGQWQIFVFPWTFSTIDHLIMYDIFASFNDHIYFYNSIFLFCYLWLKSFLWFPNRSLEVVAASTKYKFSSSLISFSTSALYIKFGVCHWFWKDHYFSLYSCIYLVILSWSNDLICPTIIDDILLMQL